MAMLLSLHGVLLIFFNQFLVAATQASPSRLTLHPEIKPAVAANATVGAPHAPVVRCDGISYGKNLRLNAGLQALAKISQDPATVTFEMTEPQEEPGTFVVLPHRVMSDDGRLFIEIGMTDARNNDNRVGMANRAWTDNASWRRIHHAADAIIRSCVSPRASRGGRVTNIGVEGLLTITVSSYDNSKIRCHNPDTTYTAPRYSSCLELTDMLQKSKNVINWLGPRPYPVLSFDWQCRLIIQVPAGRLDRVSWRDIWAALVAMVEMCAKHGKIATVSGFGNAHNMDLLLSAGEQETSSVTTS